MNPQHYHCSIAVRTTAQQAFEAINNVKGWWAENFEGSSKKLHDNFTVRFGETFGTFKITEFEQDKKVTWLCTDSYLDLLKNKAEWKGTEIVWRVSIGEKLTQIDMAHVGLVPGIECYNDCEKGWNFYIKESLFGFLNRQKGQPGTGIMATVSAGGRTYKGTLFSVKDPAPDFPGGYIFLDVKETNVEHVTAYYAVGKYDQGSFDLSRIKGKHFMVLVNKAVFENIEPFEDLMKAIK